LTVGDESESYFASNIESIRGLSVLQPLRLSDDDVKTRFPYLAFCSRERPPGVDGVRPTAVLEAADAGYINPRLFCVAQQTVASRGGCHVIRDTVSDVVEERDGNGEVLMMRATTEGGLTIRARKVLLATGAFTDFRRLLPPGVNLRLQRRTQSVLFAQLTPTDVERLRYASRTGKCC
jgi:glycine/D-amino acid oxidase-like deaminating enzyme